MLIHLGAAALLALAVQLFAMFGPLGGDDLPRRVLLVLSYLLLIAFVAANLRRPGLLIIGAGLLLNFAAIVANGGLMPVTPEALARAGYQIPEDVSSGDWVPGSKDVLLDREDVRLWFLGDRFVWRELPKFRAFSIGDVLILAGFVVTAGELLLPRLERVPGESDGRRETKPGAPG